MRAQGGGVAVAIAIALTAAIGGCARQPLPAQDRPPAATAGTARPAAIILDADPHGAIVLDDQGRYVGVRRDGSTAWREPAGVAAFGMATCLARCPDAALSGIIDITRNAGTADPEPRLVVDGRWRRLPHLDGHRRRILTADAPDRFVLVTGDRERWWLEARSGGGVVARARIGGFDTAWRESADGRHALAVTATPNGGEARWSTRTRAGWRVVGETIRVPGFSACVAPDGSRALLLGQRPMLLDRDGRQRPVTDLIAAGACALTVSGGIVAELAQTAGGLRSRLRVFGADGTVRWRLDVPSEAAVAADPTAPRVAYLVDRVLHELDPASGAELRTIPGIQAARYDAKGGLVTVGEDGAVTWRR